MCKEIKDRLFFCIDERSLFTIKYVNYCNVSKKIIEQLKMVLLAADITMSFIFCDGHGVWRRHVVLAQKVLM